MNIDESKSMDDQYLSQDMMSVRNEDYTVDVDIMVRSHHNQHTTGSYVERAADHAD